MGIYCGAEKSRAELRSHNEFFVVIERVHSEARCEAMEAM